MSNLPEVARPATITVCGVDLTVHVLDDGQRVINAAMASSTSVAGTAPRFLDLMARGLLKVQHGNNDQHPD